MSDSPNIFEQVIEDLRDRDRVGWVSYGRSLQAFDGRDTLWDAYEEALDLAMYLRKAINERDQTEGLRRKHEDKTVEHRDTSA